MLKWLGLSVLALIAGTSVYLYIHLGAHLPVVARVEVYPSLKLAYKDHLGAYHKIHPLLVEVEEELKSQGLSCPKTFGLFLDNPETTDQDRLRSQVGCVIDTDSNTTEKLENIGMKTQSIASAQYVYGRFEGSPSIGPFVVYPKLKQLAAEQRLALNNWALEIYTLSRNGKLTTEYLLPVE